MVIPSLPADGCSPAKTHQTHQTHRYVVHLFCSDLCLNISQERSRWKNITIKKYKSLKNYKNLPWKNYVMCYYSYKHFYVQNCSQVWIFQSRVNNLLKSFWIIFWSVDRFDSGSANNCLCFSKCISNCYVRNYFSCQNMLELPIKYCIFSY